MKKRLLAGFLSLVLVLSLLPTAALAGLETAAAGTEIFSNLGLTIQVYCTSIIRHLAARTHRPA